MIRRQRQPNLGHTERVGDGIGDADRCAHCVAFRYALTPSGVTGEGLS